MHSPAFMSDLSPTRVLIAEPSDRVRDLYDMAFRDFGCEMKFARDGFEALSLTDTFEPSMVFANTQLSRLDGYRLASVITRHKKFKDRVPVILVSQDADLFEKAHGRIMGAREHLTHPIDVSSLREAFYRNA